MNPYDGEIRNPGFSTSNFSTLSTAGPCCEESVQVPSEVVTSLISTMGILTAVLTFVATIHFMRDWGSSGRRLFKLLEVLTTLSIILMGASTYFVIGQSEFTQVFVANLFSLSELFTVITGVLVAVSIIISGFAILRGLRLAKWQPGKQQCFRRLRSS